MLGDDIYSCLVLNTRQPDRVVDCPRVEDEVKCSGTLFRSTVQMDFHDVARCSTCGRMYDITLIEAAHG